MNFREVMEAIAEKLLCDQCLALIRREPETKIGEFCPRCIDKMGHPFTSLFAELTADWDVDEAVEEQEP